MSDLDLKTAEEMLSECERQIQEITESINAVRAMILGQN